MKQALFYSLKVWLTAVLSGPLVILTLTKVITPRYGALDSTLNILGSVALLVYLGFIVSIPSCILLWLSTFLLLKGSYNTASKIAIISAVAIALSLLPFYILFSHDDNPWQQDLFIWIAAYIVAALISIWFYKLPTQCVCSNNKHT